MHRIALSVLMIGLIAVLGTVLSFSSVAAQGTQASAIRSFNPATVAPGGTVTVTIQAADYGQAGGVTETLPTGVRVRLQPPRGQPGDGVERQPGQVHPAGGRLLHLRGHCLQHGGLPHLLRQSQGLRAGRLPRGRRFHRHGGGSQHSDSQRHPELQPGDGGPRRDGDGDHPSCRTTGRPAGSRRRCPPGSRTSPAPSRTAR